MPADKAALPASVNLKLPRFSRYRASSFYPDLENSFGRWPFMADSFPKRDDDSYQVVQPEEEFRCDLIAYRVYGSAFLWWVVALANEVRNPLSFPKSGSVIRLPSFDWVFPLLSRT